jgi:hypothetical protein
MPRDLFSLGKRTPPTTPTTPSRHFQAGFQFLRRPSSKQTLPCPGLQVIEKQQLRRCMSCGNGPFSDDIPTRAQYTAISYCVTDTAYGYLAASRFLYIGNTTELPRPTTGGTVQRGASSSSFNQYGREKAKTQRSWLDHCVLAAFAYWQLDNGHTPWPPAVDLYTNLCSPLQPSFNRAHTQGNPIL